MGLSFLGLKVSRASFGPWANLKARFKAEMFGGVFARFHFGFLSGQQAILS